MPLHKPDGTVFGTLCALDPEAAELSESNLDALKLMARLVEKELAEQDSAAVRDRWLGILAHDLRTPLHNIRIANEVMRRTTDVEQLTNQIDRNVDRMSEMVGSILEFAKARSIADLQLEPVGFDLLPWLRELIDDYPEAELVVPPGSLHVTADRNRLAQALGNLFDNARKHSTDRRFQVSIEQDECGCSVAVRNATAGEVSEPSMLFEPFVRGPTADQTGIGLGLHLARLVMVAHGGSLSCEWLPGAVVFRATLRQGSSGPE